MDTIILAIATATTAALLSMEKLVVSGAINLCSDKQLLKQIIIFTNEVYWKNKGNEAMLSNNKFKMLILMMLMMMTIGFFALIIALQFVIIIALLVSVIILASKQKNNIISTINNPLQENEDAEKEHNC